MRDPDHPRRRLRVRGHPLSPRSLERRLARIQQLLALGLILLFAGFSIYISARTFERQESTFLYDSAAQMARSITMERRTQPDLAKASQAALQEDAPVGVYIRVLDAKGTEILSTPGQGAPEEHRHEIRVPLQGGAAVLASMSVEPRRRAVLGLILALGVTALPLLLIISASSRVIARRALLPLSRIASQAESTSWDGEVRRFSSDSDPQEIRVLSGSFDRLLERLNEILQAERTFTQDAAHELRTPLTVLCGEIEYAVQDPSIPPHIRDGLDRALQQARSMSDLVEALLLLLRGADPLSKARGELGQPVNLSDLVRDLDREFRDAERARARDFDVAAEDEVLVRGHSTLLTSAIRNLFSNAFKFTASGQEIRVRVYNGAGRGTVVVEDGGPGIASADRERVFDPFFRSAEARAGHEGFGLGLPILRRVARAHGGDVLVSSSALGGARFELFIPSWISPS